MKGLRIITTFKPKKDFDIARQTNYINLEELMSGEKKLILPQGKIIKDIQIDIVDIKVGIKVDKE